MERKCTRCNTIMTHYYTDKKGRQHDLVLYSQNSFVDMTTKDANIFCGFHKDVHVFVCPQCGEVSLVINTDGLNKYKDK